MLFAIGDVVVRSNVAVRRADEDVRLEHFCVVKFQEERDVGVLLVVFCVFLTVLSRENISRHFQRVGFFQQ